LLLLSDIQYNLSRKTLTHSVNDTQYLKFDKLNTFALQSVCVELHTKVLFEVLHILKLS